MKGKNEKYLYVQLKLKKIDTNIDKEKRILLQIGDLTDKVLYDELKSENSFQKTINKEILEDCKGPIDALEK